jgi:hypothetical protein
MSDGGIAVTARRRTPRVLGRFVQEKWLSLPRRSEDDVDAGGTAGKIAARSPSE